MKITLDKLSAGYDGKRLFSDISAELQPGKPHFLAGPNGGGKSTLLKLMCNYLQPVSGTVLLDDKPIGKYSFAERARRLGVVWQSVRPGLDFSVLDMAAEKNISLLDAYLRHRLQEEKKVAAAAQMREQAARQSAGSLSRGAAETPPEQDAFLRAFRAAL